MSELQRQQQGRRKRVVKEEILTDALLAEDLLANSRRCWDG